MDIKDLEKIDNIYVLCGGISVEHEISLISAQNIINALYEDYNIYPIFIDKEGRWASLGKITERIEKPEDLYMESIDEPALSIGRFLYEDYRAGYNNFFIPCLHGTYGEDGIIQGVLEAFDVPYMGCGPLASALCMDKAVSNQIFEYSSIDQADFLVLEKGAYQDMDPDLEEKIDNISYPVFVKPANAGSSVGVSRVDEKEDLEDALKLAFTYDEKILIEEAIEGRELEVAVMGNDFPVASLPGEHLIEGHEFFNYDSKYKDEKTILMTPAEVTEDVEDRVRRLACKAYKTMSCRGLARVDIFLAKDGRLLVNEINTFPGMTQGSLFPLLWKPTAGLDLKELLEKLIAYGLDNYQSNKEKRRIL